MNKSSIISIKMRTFAERNNWIIRNGYIYGKEQGYLMTGFDGQGTKNFITPVPGILQEQSDELSRSLEKNRDTMKLDGHEITDGFLAVRIKDSSSLKSDDIEFILALLTGILNDLSIVTENRCQECGELGAEKEDFMYDLYCYMHPDCSEKFFASESEGSESISEDEIKDETEEDHKGGASAAVPPGKLKKILFTLAGALIGAVPWLIMPFVTDMLNDLLTKAGAPDWTFSLSDSLITCICAYLVSYFALTGYKLSGAVIDKRGRWSVAIISVAVVVLIQFAYLAVLILKEPSVKLNFNNYYTNLIKYSFYTKMLINAAIGTVFTLIAVLPFFDSSKDKTRSSK